MRHDRVVARPEAEVKRVAIRLGADDELRAHDPAAAGLVDQDQRLGGIFGPDFLDGPGQQIGRATRRKRDDDIDRLGRVFILCHGDAGDQQGGYQRNDEASDNNPFHFFPPLGVEAGVPIGTPPNAMERRRAWRMAKTICPITKSANKATMVSDMGRVTKIENPAGYQQRLPHRRLDHRAQNESQRQRPRVEVELAQHVAENTECDQAI